MSLVPSVVMMKDESIGLLLYELCVAGIVTPVPVNVEVSIGFKSLQFQGCEEVNCICVEI